jgi:hypothetical protein
LRLIRSVDHVTPVATAAGVIKMAAIIPAPQLLTSGPTPSSSTTPTPTSDTTSSSSSSLSSTTARSSSLIGDEDSYMNDWRHQQHNREELETKLNATIGDLHSHAIVATNASSEAKISFAASASAVSSFDSELIADVRAEENERRTFGGSGSGSGNGTATTSLSSLQLSTADRLLTPVYGSSSSLSLSSSNVIPLPPRSNIITGVLCPHDTSTSVATPCVVPQVHPRDLSLSQTTFATNFSLMLRI